MIIIDQFFLNLTALLHAIAQEERKILCLLLFQLQKCNGIQSEQNEGRIVGQCHNSRSAIGSNWKKERCEKPHQSKWTLDKSISISI